MSHNSNYAFTATFTDKEGNTTSGTDYTFAKAFTTGTASQTGITRCNGTNCVVACSCNTANGWTSEPPTSGDYITATTDQSFAYTASDGASYASYQTQLSGPSIEDGVTTSSYQTSLSSNTTSLASANNGASYASILASNGASLASSPALAAASLQTLNGTKTCYKTTKPDCDENNGYYFYEATEEDPNYPGYFDKIMDEQIYDYVAEYDPDTGYYKTYYNAEKKATEGCYKPVCRSGYITSGYGNDNNHYRLVSAPYPGETNSYFTTPVRTFDTIAKDNGINCYISPRPVTIKYSFKTQKTKNGSYYTYTHRFERKPKFITSNFVHHSMGYALGYTDQDDPEVYVGQDVTDRFDVTAIYDGSHDYCEYNLSGYYQCSAPDGDPAAWGNGDSLHSGASGTTFSAYYGSPSTKVDTDYYELDLATKTFREEPSISYTTSQNMTFGGYASSTTYGVGVGDGHLYISRLYDNLTKTHHRSDYATGGGAAIIRNEEFVETSNSSCPDEYPYYYSNPSSQQDKSVYTYKTGTTSSYKSGGQYYGCYNITGCASVVHHLADGEGSDENANNDYTYFGSYSSVERNLILGATKDTSDVPAGTTDTVAAANGVFCYLPKWPTHYIYKFKPVADSSCEDGIRYNLTDIDFVRGAVYDLSNGTVAEQNYSDRFRLLEVSGSHYTSSCREGGDLVTDITDVNGNFTDSSLLCDRGPYTYVNDEGVSFSYDQGGTANLYASNSSLCNWPSGSNLTTNAIVYDTQTNTSARTASYSGDFRSIVVFKADTSSGCPTGYSSTKPNPTYFQYDKIGNCYIATDCQYEYGPEGTGAGGTHSGLTCKKIGTETECPTGYFSEGIPLEAWAHGYASGNPLCYKYTGSCATGYTMSTTDTGLCVAAPDTITSGMIGYGKYCCPSSCPSGYYSDVPNSTYFNYTTSNGCYKVTGCKSGYATDGNSTSYTYHDYTCKKIQCSSGYYYYDGVTNSQDKGLFTYEDDPAASKYCHKATGCATGYSSQNPGGSDSYYTTNLASTSRDILARYEYSCYRIPNITRFAIQYEKFINTTARTVTYQIIPQVKIFDGEHEVSEDRYDLYLYGDPHPYYCSNTGNKVSFSACIRNKVNYITECMDDYILNISMNCNNWKLESDKGFSFTLNYGTSDNTSFSEVIPYSFNTLHDTLMNKDINPSLSPKFERTYISEAVSQITLKPADAGYGAGVEISSLEIEGIPRTIPSDICQYAQNITLTSPYLGETIKGTVSGSGVGSDVSTTASLVNNSGISFEYDGSKCLAYYIGTPYFSSTGVTYYNPDTSTPVSSTSNPYLNGNGTKFVGYTNYLLQHQPYSLGTGSEWSFNNQGRGAPSVLYKGINQNNVTISTTDNSYGSIDF